MSYKAYIEIKQRGQWDYYGVQSLNRCLQIVGCTKKTLKPVLPNDSYKKLVEFLTGKKTFVWLSHKELLQIPIAIPFKATIRIFRPKLVEKVKATHNLFKTVQEELADIANKNHLKSEDVRLVLEYNI